jgi:octaprenyl-diphosphate synthase
MFKMNYLSLIENPIQSEFTDYMSLFNSSLDHGDGMLRRVLDYVGHKPGKGMRPKLMLLMAKNYGTVTDVTFHSAVGLELLHTASIIHDDVVDESRERRGQKSVNAGYGNKIAVLAGDYILSTALLHMSFTHSERIVRYLSRLGQTLAEGEIEQLSNIHTEDFSELAYYNVIRKKTAALFEACAGIGALSTCADEKDVDEAKKFGENIGIIFQIRDDIFDYYDSSEIGKPTGNDMAEGKLTLPALFALNSTANSEMIAVARKVKAMEATNEEIASLVEFTKASGGIEYAEKCMMDFHAKCKLFISNHVSNADIKKALSAYIDFVVERDK